MPTYHNFIVPLDSLVRGENPTPEALRTVVEEDEDVEPLQRQVRRGVGQLQKQLRDHRDRVDRVLVLCPGEGLRRPSYLSKRAW